MQKQVGKLKDENLQLDPSKKNRILARGVYGFSEIYVKTNPNHKTVKIQPILFILQYVAPGAREKLYYY